MATKMTMLLHNGARTHHQDQPMIPASFSAIRGITARGSWPGSDSRHDDPCPLVTLRAYPAGGSPHQREPSREGRPPDQRQPDRLPLP